MKAFRFFVILCAWLVITICASPIAHSDNTIIYYRLPNKSKEILTDTDSLILSNEKKYYPYGNGNLDSMIGRSVQAVIKWARLMTQQDYEAEVFNLRYPAFVYVVPFEESKEVQEEAYRKQRDFFLQNRYRFFPTYNDCDVNRLLKDKTILLNYGVMMKDDYNIDIEISVFMPWSGTEPTISESIRYLKVYLEYQFKLAPNLKTTDSETQLDQFAEMIEKSYAFVKESVYNNKGNLPDRLKKNIYDSFFKHILESFSWQLPSISIYDASIFEFINETIPKNIYDLF